MPLKLNSSGGGSVTLDVPSTASTFTVTVPASSATLATTNGGNTIEFGAGSASAPSITTSGDTNTGIAFPAADTVAVATGGTERMRIDSSGNLLFNSGYGSVATAYGCRAWVNFNGTGTVAIRASGNVSSVADNGTGNYTVNFTNAMPDANYCAVAHNKILDVVSRMGLTTVDNRHAGWAQINTFRGADSLNTSIVAFDPSVVELAVFR